MSKPIEEQVAVSGEVQAFLAAQVASGDMTTEDVLYFLEKPWKWRKEFTAWRLHIAEGVSARLSFLCTSEDVDESAGAYELSDPKHPTYHERMSDAADGRF